MLFFIHLSPFKLIFTVTKSVFIKLCRIAQLRHSISVKDAETIICAFVSSRLDYIAMPFLLVYLPVQIPGYL